MIRSIEAQIWPEFEKPPQSAALVAKSMQREKYALGSKMFSFGEIGDKLFVVASGKVRISRNVSGMGEEALAVLGPGQVFGEMSLFDEAPRSADAIVHESCEVLTITRAAFDELLFLHKGLAYEVLWNAVKILSSRLRETNDKLTFLSMSQKF